MPIHSTQALVLKKQDFRETSLIVDFYTRDFGRLSGILKGIRKTPAKFASTLEPFSLNDIIFYKKISTSLHLVSQCDVKKNFSQVRRSIEGVSTASVITELIRAVMQPEDKNEEIFDLAVNCLNELELSSNPDKILTIFKIKVLSLSGFKPHFDSCVSCHDRILGQSKFSLSVGGLLCPKCYRKDLSARSIFRGTVASILHIEKNELKNNLNLGMNPQIKKELGIILNAFLHYHLEKELKSERVFYKLSNESQGYRTQG